MTIRVPLRKRGGGVHAYALVDDCDRALVEGCRWSRQNRGYATRKMVIDGKSSVVLMHRVILGLTTGDGLQADHINGNRLDNRRANLRVVTPAQNQQNLPARPVTSVHRGVSFYPRHGKWRAYASQGGRQVRHAYFATEEEAAEAARAFRAELMTHSEER